MPLQRLDIARCGDCPCHSRHPRFDEGKCQHPEAVVGDNNTATVEGRPDWCPLLAAGPLVLTAVHREVELPSSLADELVRVLAVAPGWWALAPGEASSLVFTWSGQVRAFVPVEEQSPGAVNEQVLGQERFALTFLERWQRNKYPDTEADWLREGAVVVSREGRLRGLAMFDPSGWRWHSFPAPDSPVEIPAEMTLPSRWDVLMGG
jgi:hypothetical protein